MSVYRSIVLVAINNYVNTQIGLGLSTAINSSWPILVWFPNSYTVHALELGNQTRPIQNFAVNQLYGQTIPLKMAD